MRNHNRTSIRTQLRALAVLGFCIHLAVYEIVNLMLIFINYSTTPQSLWFQWPLFGWGIGLVFHGVAVFVWPRCVRIATNRELR